jgi:hypothetical protein
LEKTIGDYKFTLYKIIGTVTGPAQAGYPYQGRPFTNCLKAEFLLEALEEYGNP